MSTININELNTVSSVSDEEAVAVKGGAGYLKLEGIDGEVEENKSGPKMKIGLSIMF